jgi:hypothetical protein
MVGAGVTGVVMLTSVDIVGCGNVECVQAAQDRGTTSLVGSKDDIKAVVGPWSPVAFVTGGVGPQAIIPEPANVGVSPGSLTITQSPQ